MAEQSENQPKEKKKAVVQLFEKGAQCRTPKEEPKNEVRPSERNQQQSDKKE